MSTSMGLEADTFKILLASDIHLGYEAQECTRKDDSLTTFGEILEIAVEHAVDFLLLCGDLFHENHPPRHVEHEALRLLRHYCFGDRPVRFEFLSDQSENFSFCAFPNVNYEDPNLNVSLPVFTIHGNHDDPSGADNLSCIDVLATSGLINYFGKVTELDQIRATPLLLRKGKSLLALYGLGWTRDGRLHRLFRDGKVAFSRPVEEVDRWFNLMVIHQNRNAHTATDYIPEEFLPDFMDLVVWGHEHECRMDPEWNGRYHVIQPGSSVATSLCHGEAVKKHVGILEVCCDGKKAHKVIKVPLKTVRPFTIKDVSLFDMASLHERAGENERAEAAIKFCAAHVEELIAKSRLELSGDPRQPVMPLVRLRVEYGEGHETFGFHRFARLFHDRVANPRTIVVFHRTRTCSKSTKGSDMDAEQLCRVLQSERVAQARVADLVHEYFETVEESKQLVLLSNTAMQRAVDLFVDKQCKEAVKEMVVMQERRALELLTKRVADLGTLKEEKLDEEIDRLRHAVSKERDVADIDHVTGRVMARAERDTREDVANGAEGVASTRRGAWGRTTNSATRRRRVLVESEDEEIIDDDDDDIAEFSFVNAKRGGGRGRAQRSRGSTLGRGRKRGLD